MIQQIEKAYDEVENNRPPTHANYFMLYKVFSIVQKLSNKQNAKVGCSFAGLRTAHSKKQEAV